MSSGERFLKRKDEDYVDLSIDHSHLVNAVSQYLQSLSLIPDVKDVKDITIIEGLSGKANLRIHYTNGGATN